MTALQGEAAAKQQVYEAKRRAWREGWQVSNAEEFCARKEVDPETGKWLVHLT